MKSMNFEKYTKELDKSIEESEYCTDEQKESNKSNRPIDSDYFGIDYKTFRKNYCASRSILSENSNKISPIKKYEKNLNIKIISLQKKLKTVFELIETLLKSEILKKRANLSKNDIKNRFSLTPLMTESGFSNCSSLTSSPSIKSKGESSIDKDYIISAKDLVKKFSELINCDYEKKREENILTFNSIFSSQIIVYLYFFILKNFGLFNLIQEKNSKLKNNKIEKKIYPFVNNEFIDFFCSEIVDFVSKLIFVYNDAKLHKFNFKYKCDYLYFLLGEISRKQCFLGLSDDIESVLGYYDKAILISTNKEDTEEVSLVDLEELFIAKAKLFRGEKDMENICECLYEGFMVTKGKDIKEKLIYCIENIFKLSK